MCAREDVTHHRRGAFVEEITEEEHVFEKGSQKRNTCRRRDQRRGACAGEEVTEGKHDRKRDQRRGTVAVKEIKEEEHLQ